MNRKKRELVVPGARVRVADPLEQGAARWEKAQPGTAVFVDDHGVDVRLDSDDNGHGKTKLYRAAWGDVDVERKSRAQWMDVAVGEIGPSRWQYRRRFGEASMLELAESIRQAGLINRPLVFRDEEGGIELISGERRVRACAALAISAVLSCKLDDAVGMVCAADYWEQKVKLLGSPKAKMHTVAVEVRPGCAADFREIVILENLQREDPSAVEEAEGFRVLLEEEGYSQTMLAKRLGKSQGYVSQRLGLLGLAADVREVVEGQEISFTSARAIATLPKTVQAAVASHVQELAKAEGGETQTTSRKVQAMVSQVKRFVDPENWTVPEGTVVEPVLRNRLRLLRYVMEHAAPEGDAVVALRGDGSFYSKNLVGMQPMSVATDEQRVLKVVQALLSGVNTLEAAWARAARANGWMCDGCRLRDVEGIARGNGALSHCERWDGRQVETCMRFIGQDDPMVLELSYEEMRSIEELGAEVVKAERMTFMSDPAAYVAFARAAREAREAAAKVVVEAKAVKHLGPLQEYWDAVSGEDSPFEMEHAQAHHCERCVHNVWYHGEELPPCRFAEEPFRSGWDGGETQAPGMGVMVREDGVMVPRCRRFRAAELVAVAELGAVAKLEGMVIPKGHRKEVLAWLEDLARVSNPNPHGNALGGVLAWLPYERDEWEEESDREKMVRWVRDHWKALGDEGVAGLMAVARSEARAMGKWQEPVELVNPATGETERWAAVVWAVVQGRQVYGHWGTYPKGWPRPWEKEETAEGEAG